MYKKILILLLFSFSAISYAQNVDVKGTITEGSSGQPLPGVNILIKNTSRGATTDFDGIFAINDVPINSVLVISYLGYVSQEIAVVNSDPINIVLQEDTETLNEVVVIGYGSQTKKEVTGAVSTVSSETLSELAPVKVEQALQGTVSGVNVTTQSGAPGAGLDIRIRGISTNGTNGPAVFIDGYQGDLSLLNPNDIETITVLKDAQAAIYGTIGANGVILITTKTGSKNSKTKVAFNTYVGFQETTRKLPLLNATEYALILNESYAAAGQNLPYPNVSGLGVGTDWQDEVFNASVPIVNHDFSVSGGSEKLAYTISGSHLYQQGIIAPKKTDFRRNTARLSLRGDISDKIKFSSNVIYTYLDRDSVNDFGLGSVLFNALNAPPTLSAYDQNGDFSLVPNTAGLGIEIINPLAQIENTFNDFDLRKLNGSFSVDYQPTDQLTFTSRIGFNTTEQKGKSFAKIVDYGGKVFDVTRSSVSQNSENFNDYTLDLFANYKDTFFEDHNVTATLGTTIYKTFGSGLFATGYDVPNNDWAYADISLATGTGADGVRDVSSYAFDERRMSVFGRLQYDYKGKYLLSAMLRRDMSTKFGPNNRVAYFPSATAGWVVSDEEFLNDSSLINFLKLRVSYGVLGNDQIPNNGYVGQLNGEATYVFDGILTNGVAIGQLPNPDLQWEEAKKFDVGLDFRILDNKIDVTTDYFINKRDNLLISNIPVSGIAGVYAPGGSSPTINAGGVENRGFEFAINYKDDLSENLKLSVSYNLTTLTNEVTEVNNSTGFIEGGTFGVGQPAISRMEVGQPIGYFYGYKTDGIFQNQAEVDAHPSQLPLGANASPGDLRYVDVNNDGVIDTDDRTNLGDPIPDVTMGLNLTLNWKNLDFTAYAFASIGNDMVRNYERTLTDVNQLNYVLDRWTGEGTSNTVPRVTTAATTNNVFSDYFVEDASYLRLQNVQLGYNLPADVIESMGFTKVRLYCGVNNLVTLTKYRGYDPGATSGAPIGGGIDFGFYPIPRTYLFGLNLNF
ncbi:MAG: SusC/RagA family protein [Winogradskyella sp.]|uniref:TonB-dependent receptor n=1 Tax=Winogradskyella poriferorum TaxID=307627 RepID=A0ABU7W7A8_9FLAO|nr:SusC/RagA family protein [Winogradskyella sp.]|tara:strand:+ start:2137 stop:5187 length:3051 start_codon:yes stop_codon:yes gene_type:complete